MTKKEQISLLTMTYGKLSKLNGSLYITTKPDVDNNVYIVNINTGDIVEKRSFNSSFGRNDVVTSKFGLVYTQPDLYNNYDFLKIYNNAGELITSIEVPGFEGTKHKEYIIRSAQDNNKRMLIEILYKFADTQIIIYNQTTKKVEEYVKGVLRVVKINENNIFKICIKVKNETFERYYTLQI